MFVAAYRWVDYILSFHVRRYYNSTLDIGSNHEVHPSNARCKLIELNNCGGRLVLKVYFIPFLNTKLSLI